jgi:hypothetical protein
LIGADGFRSTVRGLLMPDLKPAYCGYIAWRALAPEGDIPVTAWALVRARYVFCLPEASARVLPVPTRESDARPGSLSYNIAWYRPADDGVLANLWTYAAGQLHEFSIPLPPIRAEVVAKMQACARALLAPPHAG